MAITIALSPPTLNALSHPVPYTINADAGWAGLPRYHVRAVVTYEPVYRSGTFVDLITLQGWPDAAGKVIFDLRSAMARKVDTDPPTIDEDGELCERMNARFRIVFQEWHTGALQSSSSLQTLHGVRSNLPWRWAQVLATYGSSGRFLTHAPLSREVSEWQPEQLYFVVPSTMTLSMEAVATHDDGTTTTLPVWSGLAVEANDIIRFSAGYRSLSLHTLTPTVVSWTVKLKAAGIPPTVVSEVREYRLACHCCPLDRFFLFENSLGGWDTVRTTGRAKTAPQVSGRRAQRRLGPYRSALDWETIDYDTQSFDLVEQAVGYQTEEEQTWLRNLLRSERAYRVGGFVHPNPDGESALIPINIERAGTQLFEDETFLHPLTFRYRDSATAPGVDSGMAQADL